MAAGTKADPKLGKTIQTTPASAEPTDVKLTRSGDSYKLEWKRGKTHDSVEYKSQAVRFRRKVKADASSDSAWKDWSAVSVTASARSASKSYAESDYYPNTTKRLTAIQAGVRGLEKEYTTKSSSYKSNGVYYYDKTEATPKWSGYVPFLFDVKKSVVPTLGEVTPGTSSTVFAYNVKNGTDTTRLFYDVEYASRLVLNWGTKDPSSGIAWGSGTGYKTGTKRNLESTITITEDTGLIGGTSSYTRVIRMRSRGASGPSDWAYKMYVYAYPLTLGASAITATKADISGGYRVTASFTPNRSDTHPAETFIVQYCIAEPSNGSMGVPTGASWTDGTSEFKDTAGKAAATFNVDSRLGLNEALWVRVVQKHDSFETPSEPKFVAFGGVEPAYGLSIDSYDSATGAITFSCSNPCDIPTSYLRIWAYYWANGKWNQHSYCEIPHGQTSVSKTLNLNSYSEWAFDTYVGIGGGYWSAAVRTRYSPRGQATNPAAYAPTMGSVTRGASAGSINVTWANVMTNVTSAEVAVATDPTEWSKGNPSYVLDVTVEGADIKSTTLTGLEYGVPYYVKVRTIASNGASNWSANYKAITLSATDAPTPVLTATETSDHFILVSWTWSTWTSATAINISWSDMPTSGKTDYKKNEETIQRKGNAGADNFTITEGIERGKTWYIQAEFVSNTAVSNPSQTTCDLPVNPVAPTGLTVERESQTTDEEAKSTVRVAWSNNWEDSDSTEISWSTNPNAWESNEGLRTYTLTGTQGKATTTLISNLDMGRTWYFRVKLMFGGFESAYTSPVAIDLTSDPSKPTVKTDIPMVSENAHMDVSWTYSCEDGGEQASAAILITSALGLTVAEFGVSGSDTSFALYPEIYGLTGNNQYNISVRTVSVYGRTSEWSDEVLFTVRHQPIAAIESTSLENGELTDLPLTVTVSGAESGGECTVYIERSAASFMESPSERRSGGYAGELMAIGNGTDTITFEEDAFRGVLNDGGVFTIVAYVADELGKSDPVSLDFIVNWDHKAVMPEATRETDEDGLIAKITIGEAPEDYEDGDTVDIYRLSADLPELIIENGEFGETYVDPYPAFGESGSYRVVYKTANGVYTTEDGSLAWIDLDGSSDEEGTPDARIDGDRAVIDFGGNSLELEYNLTASHSWEKDFIETKYLGGSVRGFWNPAVSRTMSLGAVSVKDTDFDKISLMRRLAVWDDICHVRTPDGSSFAADVQVSEDRTHENGGKVINYQLSVTRVDTEGLDGMTLEEWEAE